jgi:cephalosporin-C deacetylase-like acetyl esterase
MAIFDLPLDQLQGQRPTVARPDDFESFWTKALDTELIRPLEARIVPVATPLRTLDVYDVFSTLSYFDGAKPGAYATAPALFSTAGMDQICPPSTVYAAYHAGGNEDKEITYCPWNRHEGVGGHHTWLTLQWLAQRFG